MTDPHAPLDSAELRRLLDFAEFKEARDALADAVPVVLDRLEQVERERDWLRAALAAAEARERLFSIVVRHMELDGAVHGAQRYIDHLRSMLDAGLAAVPQETP